MAYALGTRAIKRLCQEQNPITWQKAKLSSALFKPYEQPVFDWVANHLKLHHALPQVDTLQAAFPDVGALETPEPSSYYVGLLENQYFYETLNKANLESQRVLKQDQDAHEQAIDVLRGGIRTITEQKYRTRILDVALDAPALVLTAYHHTTSAEYVAMFGWPYWTPNPVG